MDMADMRAVRIASQSLTNDVANLKRCVDACPAPEMEPDTKIWAFAGHQGQRVLVDRRNPLPMPSSNPIYCASSWRVGGRALDVNPVSGLHSYNTGNLYRTVHWKSDSFGINGRFSNHLGLAGMWRNEALNTNLTRNKAIADPTQWGTQKAQLSWM
mmetsp:Transcript_19647/g.32746  ORF Transcript_19647/g.32746 Transcript_19647/m.32746 type:complete len:156 (-) Transcript_19647:12-479(-)